MIHVTEVLDYLKEPELVKWIENNSKAKRKAVSDEALRIGTFVDLLVQEDISSGGYLVPEGDTPIENCMRGWEKFKKDYPLFVESVKEMQTELKDGELIGHPDFFCEDGMRSGIVDLKCASGIRPRYWTQTAQYLRMWKKGNFIAVLRLEKTAEEGLYEYKEISDLDYIKYEWSVFDAYLIAFHHNVNNRELIRKQLEEELLK